jgi:hypothetical protein
MNQPGDKSKQAQAILVRKMLCIERRDLKPHLIAHALKNGHRRYGLVVFE